MGDSNTPKGKRVGGVRRRSLVQGEEREVGDGGAKESPKAPTLQVGTLEAKQKAFSLMVANNKGTIKQKLPAAYSQIVEEFKEWRGKRPEELRNLVLGKNKKKNGEELIKEREKGLKEAGTLLTKV